MRKTIKKCMSFIFAVLIVFSVFVCKPNIYAKENNQILLNNDKTATELDANLETTIQLVFPGKQEVVPADIVFVLDKSGMSA